MPALILFGLRGPYFAIGTLGLAIAGRGSSPPGPMSARRAACRCRCCRADRRSQKLFFYYLLFALAFLTLIVVRWLYSTQLRPRAERHPRRRREGGGDGTAHDALQAHRLGVSALFLGIAGAILGNHDRLHRSARDRVSDPTFNIFMVLMVLLGGKGTLWGPVIGALVFHVIKEVTWTYFLGWQYVALGVLIVVDRRILPARHRRLALRAVAAARRDPRKPSAERPSWTGAE